MTVARILEIKGHTIFALSPSTSLHETAEVLARRHIGAVAITDDQNHLLGIISERDIVRAIASEGPRALEDSNADHMTRDVVTANEATTVVELMERMTRGRFRHVPIMRGDTLIGMVSIGDVVKTRLAEMEHEQKALRDYITLS